jgi:hypothetical protein
MEKFKDNADALGVLTSLSNFISGKADITSLQHLVPVPGTPLSEALSSALQEISTDLATLKTSIEGSLLTMLQGLQAGLREEIARIERGDFTGVERNSEGEIVSSPGLKALADFIKGVGVENVANKNGRIASALFDYIQAVLHSPTLGKAAHALVEQLGLKVDHTQTRRRLMEGESSEMGARRGAEAPVRMVTLWDDFIDYSERLNGEPLSAAELNFIVNEVNYFIQFNEAFSENIFGRRLAQGLSQANPTFRTLVETIQNRPNGGNLQQDLEEWTRRLLRAAHAVRVGSRSQEDWNSTVRAFEQHLETRYGADAGQLAQIIAGLPEMELTNEALGARIRADLDAGAPPDLGIVSPEPVLANIQELLKNNPDKTPADLAAMVRDNFNWTDPSYVDSVVKMLQELNIIKDIRVGGRWVPTWADLFQRLSAMSAGIRKGENIETEWNALIVEIAEQICVPLGSFLRVLGQIPGFQTTNEALDAVLLRQFEQVSSFHYMRDYFHRETSLPPDVANQLLLQAFGLALFSFLVFP